MEWRHQGHHRREGRRRPLPMPTSVTGPEPQREAVTKAEQASRGRLVTGLVRSPKPTARQKRELRVLQLTAELATPWTLSHHRVLSRLNGTPNWSAVPNVRRVAARPQLRAQFHHRLLRGRQASMSIRVSERHQYGASVRELQPSDPLRPSARTEVQGSKQRRRDARRPKWSLPHHRLGWQPAWARPASLPVLQAPWPEVVQQPVVLQPQRGSRPRRARTSQIHHPSARGARERSPRPTQGQRVSASGPSRDPPRDIALPS